MYSLRTFFEYLGNRLSSPSQPNNEKIVASDPVAVTSEKNLNDYIDLAVQALLEQKFVLASRSESVQSFLGYLAMTSGDIQNGGGFELYKMKNNGDINIVGIAHVGSRNELKNYSVVQIDMDRDGGTTLPKFVSLVDFVNRNIESVDDFFESKARASFARAPFNDDEPVVGG